MTGRRIALLAPLALAALAVTGCGSAPTAGGTPPSTTLPAGRGWIGGEPEWGAVNAAGGEMSATAGEVMPAGAPADRSAAPGGAAPPDAPPQTGELRAGSVDDNADFARFLEYLARYRGLGLGDRPFDPTGRIVVTVTGDNGLPAMGVPVVVSSSGRDVASLLTDPTGRAIFLPALYGDLQSGYHVAAGEASADVSTGSAVRLTVPATAMPATVPVDVLFLLDVTGSMGDEIDRLKQTIDEVAAQLSALPQHPDLRLGMTLFRDEGDTFVTRTFDFTGDVSAFRAALADVVADGGGDQPEAVEEALAAALAEPSWRDPATTVQTIFLVGDAAPHTERQLDKPWTASVVDAAQRGITIHSIAASNTDDAAEHAFRGIAEATGGRFVFMSYGAGGAAVGANTDITKTDYEELSLDALVVRLVSEELAALTGGIVTPPTTTPGTVPPTNPPGQ